MIGAMITMYAAVANRKPGEIGTTAEPWGIHQDANIMLASLMNPLGPSWCRSRRSVATAAYMVIIGADHGAQGKDEGQGQADDRRNLAIISDLFGIVFRFPLDLDGEAGVFSSRVLIDSKAPELRRWKMTEE